MSRGAYWSSGRVIHFASPKEEDLVALTDACIPATFGVGDKNVLDESYRKAGKLDADCFTWSLQISDVKTMVQKGLLPYNQEDRSITLELYKLNVYGLSTIVYLT